MKPIRSTQLNKYLERARHQEKTRKNSEDLRPDSENGYSKFRKLKPALEKQSLEDSFDGVDEKPRVVKMRNKELDRHKDTYGSQSSSSGSKMRNVGSINSSLQQVAAGEELKQ